MANETIVLCYPVGDCDVEKIRQAAADGSVIVATQENIATEIFKADIFCGHAKVPMPWSEIVVAGRLKWIQSSAAGLDHCLVPAVVDSQILVSGCSALFANQVAEQTLALLYAGIRGFPDCFRNQQAREFVRCATDSLHRKTISIVGFGGNGRRIADLLQNVAGKIIASDLFPEFDVPHFVEVLPAFELNQLFERGDVIIVTLPLTPQTEGCIGSTQFSLMKRGGYFINVARGQVVDQASLVQAIEMGTIAYAGLDVVDPEPLPIDSPLWHNDRVIITPHVGAQSPDRVSNTTELFCRNLIRFRQGKSLINLVDRNLQVPRPENRLHWGNRGEIIFPEI